MLAIRSITVDFRAAAIIAAADTPWTDTPAASDTPWTDTPQT